MLRRLEFLLRSVLANARPRRPAQPAARIQVLDSPRHLQIPARELTVSTHCHRPRSTARRRRARRPRTPVSSSAAVPILPALTGAELRAMPVPFLSDMVGRFASKRFSPEDIPSQDGKIFIVTGCALPPTGQAEVNSGHAGIGLETTRALLNAGATVYIASRTKSKVDDAIKELGGSPDKVKYIELDLMSIKSAQKAASSFTDQSKRLDGLIANAGALSSAVTALTRLGIMATPYKLTDVRALLATLTDRAGRYRAAVRDQCRAS